MELTLWGLLVLSAALSAFFSLSSNALRMFRRAELEKTFGGPAGKGRLELLERHLKSLRLATSLCRALANILLVLVILALVGVPESSWARLAAAAVVAGAVMAVVGVAIPHAWASYAGERILAATLPVLLGVRYFFHPIIWIMERFDVPIRRLTGTPEAEAENGQNAKQEILQVASEGRAEGAVDAEEVQMIESVIEFGETHAAEIMTPRTEVFALSAEMPLEEASQQIADAGHSRIPVYEDDLDHIIGILYAKDLLENVRQNQPAKLRDLIRKPFFVPETKRLDDLLREFKSRKVHIAVVLDEYGGTAGLITIEDVVEEIVGEISDEYDRAEPALMRRIDETTAEVDGRLHIDDLNDAMDLRIPEDEDYDTVAGFVFSELGYIPREGEELEAREVKFTVLAADERKITRLRVEVLKRELVEE